MDLDNPGIIIMLMLLILILPLNVYLYFENQNETKIQELAIKHRCEIIEMKGNTPIYGNCKGETQCP